ncbi:MAG: protein jag [Eubacterium sp.]|nr:protein jag [Eubacterium sp.]
MEHLEVVEKWGDSIDQAVELALRDMKLTREDVDVEVLEEPSKGFLGIIGNTLAKVRVTKKGAAKKEEEHKEEKSFQPVEKKAPEKKEEVEAQEEENTEEQKQDRRWKKNTNKKPLSELIDTEDSLTPDITTEEVDFQEQIKDLPPCEEHVALDFLKDVIKEMGLDLTMKAKANETNVYIELEGPDCGTIIGRRGQTLDALQYLTSLVVNKEHEDYIKVVIDAEDYRARREKTLEQLADKMARKAIKSHRSLKLDPMNPYERKVIHATLQSNPRVTTRSEGQDPYRRVVIEPKH